MAFAFFRKHQRVVMITMIVLMVVFLIPTAFQTMENRSRSNATVGTSNIGNITQNDLGQAQQDLFILENSELRGAEMRRMQMYRGARPMISDFEFLLIEQSGEKKAMAYALLLQEARKMGLKVSAQELQDFKDQIFQPGTYTSWAKSLIGAGRDLTEARIDDAFRDWVMIIAASAMSSYDLPPSETELKKVFRDVFEKIGLQAATLSAEELAKSNKETPSDASIVAQFNQYRSVLPGTYQDQFSYGFGYKQPAQAAISYLYVSEKALEQAVVPSQDDIDQFYRDNRENRIYVPASKPATTTASATTTTQSSQPETAAAEEEQEVVLGSMPLDKARPYIIEQLKPAMVERKMDELLSKADQLETTIKDIQPPHSVYEGVIAQMTQPATDKLNFRVRIPIKAVPVEQAIELLADDAGLVKIAFPIGQYGDKKLSPATKVTVDKGVTLQQALDQIIRQLDWIAVEKWVYLDGLEGVLLPVPADKQYFAIFPLTARQTPAMTYEEIYKDELLGKTVSAPRQGIPLAQVAFSSLIPAFKQPLKAGDKSPRMYVGGDTPGKLVFRLTMVQEATDHKAGDIANDKKLRDQVISDLKVIQAMATAEKIGKTLADAASKDGLEKAAKAVKDLKVETVDTGLFARKNYQLQFNDIPKLDIPVVPNGLREFVIDKAFSLAPKNVEPTTQGYGKSEAISLRVPAKKEVLVIQRNDFRPAVKSEFEGFGKLGLAGALMNSRQTNSVAAWFNWPNIEKRLNYKAEK